ATPSLRLRATRAINSSLAGLTLLKVSPERASTHFPPMKLRTRSAIADRLLQTSTREVSATCSDTGLDKTTSQVNYCNATLHVSKQYTNRDSGAVRFFRLPSSKLCEYSG